MIDAAAIAKELGHIYTRIAEPLGKSAPELIDELSDRCAWLPRSAEILADAQRELDVRRGEVVGEMAEKYTATVLREMLNAKCAEEQRLVNQAERLNSVLSHQIDAIRSLLSWEKAQSQLER